MSSNSSHYGFATRAIASFSFAFTIAILGLGGGTVQAHEMSRSAALTKSRCADSQASLLQYHSKFRIAPRDELIFRLRLPIVTFELRIAIKEEWIFHIAEQLYRRKLYPKATVFYRRLLVSPKRHYRQQALQRLYEIATYWLDDTWKVIKQGQEFKQPDWLAWIYSWDLLSDILPNPKSIFHKVLSYRNLLHWDESKPFFNEEGRGVELLRCIHDHDPVSPLAYKTLYLMGYIAWFHEDWRHADECFSRLEKNHPACPVYHFALELAAKAKLMRDDTTEKRQRLAEARRLVDKALKQPGLSEEKKNDLMILLACVNTEQADLDFQDAEKCRKAGRLNEACSRYRRIRKDYSGTYSAERATMRLMSIMLKDKRAHHRSAGQWGKKKLRQLK